MRSSARTTATPPTAPTRTPPGPASPPAPAPAVTAASGAPDGGAGVDTGARTTPGARAVEDGRARIDAIDARIIALVRERIAVSEGIQRARVASGGRRVSLARETQVISSYHTSLGRPGTALALALLELCRGRA